MFNKLKEVQFTMTDSRRPKALKAFKKASYVIDENLLKGKEQRQLDIHANDCIEIESFYVPVGVIRHIDKHFLTLNTEEKIDLFHRVLAFRKDNLPYAMYSQIDDRYTCEKKPCRIHRGIYIIILDDKVYEVITIFKTTFTRTKGTDDVEQIVSMYEIDPSETLRIKTIQNSKLEHYNLENVSGKCRRMLYNATKDQTFDTGENTSEPYYSSNDSLPPSHLKEKMEKVLGTISFEPGDNGEVKVTMENDPFEKQNNKIPTNALRIFLESKMNDLSIDELIDIYTSDRLPKVDARTALAMAISAGVIESNNPLSLAVNLMLNVIQTDVMPVNKMFLPNTNINDISTMSYELDKTLHKITEEIGYSIGEIRDKCIYLTK